MKQHRSCLEPYLEQAAACPTREWHCLNHCRCCYQGCCKGCCSLCAAFQPLGTAVQPIGAALGAVFIAGIGAVYKLCSLVGVGLCRWRCVPCRQSNRESNCSKRAQSHPVLPSALDATDETDPDAGAPGAAIMTTTSLRCDCMTAVTALLIWGS